MHAFLPGTKRFNGERYAIINILILPMELQMVACNRIFESALDPVLHYDSASAFRALASSLALCSASVFP